MGCEKEILLLLLQTSVGHSSSLQLLDFLPTLANYLATLAVRTMPFRKGGHLPECHKGPKLVDMAKNVDDAVSSPTTFISFTDDHREAI
jgi:hypothetical protein